jgi:hypothetical protein
VAGFAAYLARFFIGNFTAHGDDRGGVAAQRNRTIRLDRTAKEVQRLDAEYSLVILGAFESWSLVEDNPRANAVAVDGITSSLIASGIITPALKYGVGRVRPANTIRSFQFK